MECFSINCIILIIPFVSCSLLQLMEATPLGKIGQIVPLHAEEEIALAIVNAPSLCHNMVEKIVQTLDQRLRQKAVIQTNVQVNLSFVVLCTRTWAHCQRAVNNSVLCLSLRSWIELPELAQFTRFTWFARFVRFANFFLDYSSTLPWWQQARIRLVIYYRCLFELLCSEDLNFDQAKVPFLFPLWVIYNKYFKITLFAVDGVYGSWGQWSECSKTCGKKKGTTRRDRLCNDPAPKNGGKDCSSLGEDSETKPCKPKLKRCPGKYRREIP